MVFTNKIKRQIAEIKKCTFLDPTIDIVFKRLFSVNRILIHFLNAILHLPDKDRIVFVQPQKKVSVKLSTALGSEEVRFDIHAKLNNGDVIDLEMQRAGHSDFLDRIELYASQLTINSKISFDKARTDKERVSHPYLMPRTYSVWLCNFNVPFCKTYREELGVYRRSDIGKRGSSAIYDKKRYIIIDLTKYKSCANPQEAEWLYFFTHVATAKAMPATKDGVIADAYARLKVKSNSEEFISEVAYAMVTKAEILTRLNDARVEGHKEGRKEVACQMLSMNFPIESIIKICRLPKKEILALKRGLLPTS